MKQTNAEDNQISVACVDVRTLLCRIHSFQSFKETECYLKIYNSFFK